MTIMESAGKSSASSRSWSETVGELQSYPFRKWYMIAVRPNREQEAADSFRRRNIRAYWPNHQRLQPVRGSGNGRGRRGLSYVAMIPGLIFTPLSTSVDFWDAIERVEGVTNVVRSDSGHPLLISEADIETVRRIEAGLNLPPPTKVLHSFKIGDRVRFLDDTVNRWPPGKVARLASDGRIGVEVQAMGRVVTVLVFPHQIGRT